MRQSSIFKPIWNSLTVIDLQRHDADHRWRPPATAWPRARAAEHALQLGRRELAAGEPELQSILMLYKVSI